MKKVILYVILIICIISSFFGILYESGLLQSDETKTRNQNDTIKSFMTEAKKKAMNQLLE